MQGQFEHEYQDARQIAEWCGLDSKTLPDLAWHISRHRWAALLPPSRSSDWCSCLLCWLRALVHRLKGGRLVEARQLLAEVVYNRHLLRKRHALPLSALSSRGEARWKERTLCACEVPIQNRSSAHDSIPGRRLMFVFPPELKVRTPAHATRVVCLV